MEDSRTVTILIADDDEDDRLMAEEALKEARLVNDLHFVEDGEALLDYLKARGKYADRKDKPLPGIILLDLNMPKKDGREALIEIKADPALRQIPVIVLTTSKSEEDIASVYNLGIDSYITKPVTFAGLVEVMRTLSMYQLNIINLSE
jgi:CheY-like chemotaxis protein